MFAVRSVARTQVRSFSAPMAVRAYSDKSRAEGATASSSGFKNREQAEESVYVKKQEALQLAKLREQLAKTEKEKADLQKKVQDLEGKAL